MTTPSLARRVLVIRAADTKRDFSPDHLPDARVYILKLLAELGRASYGALHLFVHEADALVRVVVWVNGCWLENCPLPQNVGVTLLGELRGRPWWRATHGDRSRCIRCTGDQEFTLALTSPHPWDVRIVKEGTAYPLVLPYLLSLPPAEVCARFVT